MNKLFRFYPFLFLLNFLMLSLTIQGQIIQSSTVDSLLQQVEKKEGVDKISAQLDLALQISKNHKTKATDLANTALLSARKIENKNLEMRSNFVLGIIFAELRDNQQSLVYLDAALILADETNDNWDKCEILFRMGVDKHRMGEYVQALEFFNSSIRAGLLADNFRTTGASYSMMGTIFRMNGMYDRAIEYIIKSKLNYKKAGFTEGSGWAAYLLGRIYSDLKLQKKALEYFNESLDIYTQQAKINGDKNGMAICYEQIAVIHIETENYEEARLNNDKALEIYDANNSKYGISNIYKNLGVIEYSTGNYTQAENYLSKALEIKKVVNDILSMPRIYEYLGLSLIKEGKAEEGLKTIQQGLDLAIANDQKKIQLDIYSKLTKTYLNLNDYDKAISSQNKQIQIQNLILAGGANIKTEQLQGIYEIDEKNNQILALEKQNDINLLNIKQQRIIRNVMILGIILALFIALVIFLFYRQIRNKNRELKESNAAKDKFFAIIAHDLRGPTGTLAAFLEHLNARFDDYSLDELKEMLQALFKSAKNVSNLLENLLIWAQSQVSKIEYRPKELELNNVLKDVLKGVQQFAENKEIQIKQESNDSILVLADFDMLQTILRNILSNAIKFTYRGGKVVVTATIENESTALVKIMDNGVGIEKPMLKKLFEITNSYHTQGTELEQSTGLGLILVKDFVEKNKGTLSIESEKGKGTVVSFTLPLADTEN